MVNIGGVNVCFCRIGTGCVAFSEPWQNIRIYCLNFMTILVHIPIYSLKKISRETCQEQVLIYIYLILFVL